jgi:hypothetical protein
MLSFTESVPGTADGQFIAAISTAFTTAEAIADFGTAVQAFILIPGLTSATFRI